MPYRLLIAALLILLTAAAVAAAPQKRSNREKSVDDKSVPLTILSIIPSQGEPGTTVTLYGAGFSAKTLPYLGNSEVPVRILSSQQLAFDIPRLAPGLYALFLRREDGTVSKVYNFSVLAPRPVADSLSPDRLASCLGEREVTVNGRNFVEGSQLMFDGSVIRSRLLGAESIAFTVPAVAGGLHQVQIRNPGDTVSTVLGLFIDTRPEIGAISIGEEHVNYYELNIEGRNFLPGSRLLVDGKQIYGDSTDSSARERVIYKGCTGIVYQRYPYSSTAKDFTVQVVNPDNSASSIIRVSAP